MSEEMPQPAKPARAMPQRPKPNPADEKEALILLYEAIQDMHVTLRRIDVSMSDMKKAINSLASRIR